MAPPAAAAIAWFSLALASACAVVYLAHAPASSEVAFLTDEDPILGTAGARRLEALAVAAVTLWLALPWAVTGRRAIRH